MRLCVTGTFIKYHLVDGFRVSLLADEQSETGSDGEVKRKCHG